MCGIVGIAGRHEVEWVRRMNSTIIYRGPDEQGEYQSPDGMVSLAMRRLSIIDLQGGHQPMPNRDATNWIVFNGEIYNAPELRQSLEEQGSRFVTQNSDTEVLLHLYEKKGVALVDDLNGMFSFVIHDQRRHLLFGARDRMGIKPLYYWQSNGHFAFASELKSLLTLPFIEREIDQQSLYHYMTLLYIPDQASIIRGVYRIPPGHTFVYDLQSQRLTLRPYWQLKFHPVECRSEAEWAKHLHLELQSAVKRWCLSDVPIGCSLSGGLDSASIVGLLAELEYPKIKTYSLGFPAAEDQAWNEMGLARQVARRWGTEHHEIFLTPQQLMDDLVAMVWHLDEPYGGGLPSWYVFKEMGRDVKVALTGIGGDELFGSYGKFRAYEANRVVHASLALRQRTKVGAAMLANCISPCAALANRLPSSWKWIGAGRGVSQLPRIVGQPFGSYYHANVNYLADDRKRSQVLQVHNGAVEDTASYLQDLYDASGAQDIRDGLASVDFRTQLAEEFLLMTDRFSMAHSLEARVPFLDHLLVEQVFRIPPSIRTKNVDPKYLLKRAVAHLLPPDLLGAPKRGFVIPIELWLRRELRPLVMRLLNPQRLRSQGIFRTEFYDAFVRPHLEGQARFTWQVWAALMFQLWHIVFIEQKQKEAPTYNWKALC